METENLPDQQHQCSCHRPDREAFLTLHTSKGIESIAFDQIAYVRGDGNSTEVAVLRPDRSSVGRRVVYGKNLKVVEAMLPRCFARVNQSFIVPIRLVRSCSQSDGLQMDFEGAPDIYPTAHYCDRIAHRLPFWPMSTKDK